MWCGEMKINVDLVAMDYDRTIASEDSGFKISEPLKELLLKIPQKTILATGRVLEDIPDQDAVEIFDALVVENGTILVTEGGIRKEVLVNKEWLGKKRELIKMLRDEGFDFRYGEVIIFGDKREARSLESWLRRYGLMDEVFIDFNKDGFMILPAGWNKGRGVKIAAAGLGGGRLMAIGDEINDLPLFEIADLRVAVGNAVKELKMLADIICDGDNGKGVIEVLSSLMEGK